MSRSYIKFMVPMWVLLGKKGFLAASWVSRIYSPMIKVPPDTGAPAAPAGALPPEAACPPAAKTPETIQVISTADNKNGIAFLIQNLLKIIKPLKTFPL
jgi:hypothetical protein